MSHEMSNRETHFRQLVEKKREGSDSILAGGRMAYIYQYNFMKET